ncbi:MAG: ribonuclease HI [Eubacteriales bacterium]|nr:ribonuclease HI [Eubacteriales bacterium]MDY5439811.1 ribonuclease HI [Eubacteriales bacterium]
MKKVDIYTDGACSCNPGPGGWGVVLLYKNVKKEISGFMPDTTNNRMELFAVLQGLRQLKESCDVTLYSDSAYFINAINNGWLKDWEKNNWKTSDKKPVKNLDLWQALLQEMKKHQITYVKVKGHADNEYNNRCDKLATDEIKKKANQTLIG